MKKLLSTVFLIVLSICIYCSEASAQRTADKSIFIGFAPTVSAYSLPSGGLDLNAGGYLRNSFWKAGVRAVDWNHRTNMDDQTLEYVYDHINYQFYGGWMYRLVGTHNRVFNWYLGASAYIGLNQYEAFRSLPKGIQRPVNKDLEFAYGIVPEMELELYAGQKVAFIIGVQCPITVGTKCIRSDDWNLTASVGLRITL